MSDANKFGGAIVNKINKRVSDAFGTSCNTAGLNRYSLGKGHMISKHHDSSCGIKTHDGTVTGAWREGTGFVLVSFGESMELKFCRLTVTKDGTVCTYTRSYFTESGQAIYVKHPTNEMYTGARDQASKQDWTRRYEFQEDQHCIQGNH